MVLTKRSVLFCCMLRYIGFFYFIFIHIVSLLFAVPLQYTGCKKSLSGYDFTFHLYCFDIQQHSTNIGEILNVLITGKILSNLLLLQCCRPLEE
jgi:hypothetical protein